MKILLDENIPAKIILDFGEGYEVNTARQMGWNGKRNGELLGLATFNSFDFFITIDKNLKYQQNLEKFDIIIFLLLARDNKHQTLQPFIGQVKELLKNRSFNKFNEVSL